jgi:membrane protease YdiL (CAAX protease family)
MSFLAADNFPSGGTRTSGAVGRIGQDFLELSIGYGLILLVIWTPNPWQRWLYCLALVWIVLVTFLSFDGRKAMGWQASGFWRSSWVILLALLMASVGVFLAAEFRTLHYPHGFIPFIKRFWGYSIWALMQQFLLQNFVLLRLLRLLPDKRIAVIVAAGLFMIAHLPSPILTPVTLIWGLVACLLFLRYRNLYTLAITHAILGICLVVSVPGEIDHNMRVGRGYLTYRPVHRLISTIETISYPPTHG